MTPEDPSVGELRNLYILKKVVSDVAVARNSANNSQATVGTRTYLNRDPKTLSPADCQQQVPPQGAHGKKLFLVAQ